MATIQDLKNAYKSINVDEQLKKSIEIKKEWEYFKGKILSKTLTVEEFNSGEEVYNGKEHTCLRYLIETKIKNRNGEIGVGYGFGAMPAYNQTIWVNFIDGQKVCKYNPLGKQESKYWEVIDSNKASEVMKEINDYLYKLITTNEVNDLVKLMDNSLIKNNFAFGIVIVNESLNENESLNKYRFQQTYNFDRIYYGNILNDKGANLFEPVYKNNKSLIGSYECAKILKEIFGQPHTLEDYMKINSTIRSFSGSKKSNNNNEKDIKDIKSDTFEEDKKEGTKEIHNPVKNVKAFNKIFYGCPGSGKSYFIKNELLKELSIEDDNVVRTTFYEDYSNSDFVGQIYPQVKDNDVTYIFKPGSFTLTLKKALDNPCKPVALIVEEINRGKAPSIFGEIFQLLDRDSTGKSEYSINNFNMEEFLKVNSIFIPNNLYILATMNTSDQNVFTLDNAFKRRFNLEMISNEFKDTDTIKDLYVPGLDKITWKEFKENINDFINELDSEFISEDKQLGKYFVSSESLLSLEEETNEEKTKEFAYKVLEYLYNDIAKIIGKDKIFNKELKTLTSIINKYIELSKDNKSLDVFSEQLKSKFNKENATVEEEINKDED